MCSDGLMDCSLASDEHVDAYSRLDVKLVSTKVKAFSRWEQGASSHSHERVRIAVQCQIGDLF